MDSDPIDMLVAMGLVLTLMVLPMVLAWRLGYMAGVLVYDLVTAIRGA